MATGRTEYGDISPRTAAKAAKQLLKRGEAYLCLEKFGQAKPLDKNSSKTIIFRRYEALPTTPTALSEGVTPDAQQLDATDYPATLVQYGSLVEITDVVDDTHEDPVLSEAVDLLGTQAAEMLETVRWNVLKAGTNVYYANGSARTAVNTTITLALQKKITRALKRQRAKKITKTLKAGPNFATEPVAGAYIGLCHPDLQQDIEALTGFTPVERYSGMTPYPGEIGKVNEVRYITSVIFEPWADAGGDKGLMISTTGTKADVYPILFVAEDAYGIVPLKGKEAVKVMVLNPGQPRGGDPLAQRGSAGWKCYQTAVILNDAWLLRAEVAATE